MNTPVLLHELALASAEARPEAAALEFANDILTYAGLAEQMRRFASGLAALGVRRGDRVAVFLEKRFECVAGMFGASLAGAVVVPVNPVLRPAQVEHILRDCAVRYLLTSAPRLQSLAPALAQCTDLEHVIVVDAAAPAAWPLPATVTPWTELPVLEAGPGAGTIDADLAAIFYTSGSTGRPKGVMVTHRNLVAGAASVASYLRNSRDDCLLAALPLSFDAGFSQLTTAFLAGARVALLNYLMPQDVLRALDRHAVTGLTAVPPLYIQLTGLQWPQGCGSRLRYFANTGGRMPRETLRRLRDRLPDAQPFLMYGLTEAFRSSYLPPDQVDKRPDSIGKAIPNAEILVLRADGTPCDAEEPGELVHRGVLVSQGYWNDPSTTAARFKALPKGVTGSVFEEIAVFSGDVVRRDTEGYLYFIGRNDEMIKTSGYRVSPTEVEEALYATGLVAECAAFGVPDEALGATIAVLATLPPGAGTDAGEVMGALRRALPPYMMPATLSFVEGPLPRNANGKIDRAGLLARHLRPE